MARFFDNLTPKGFAAPVAASVLMAGVAAGSMSATGTAQAAGPDFTGKKITFLTPHRGADSVLSLKTWMKYASKNLKGNPEITVQSKFGGGGVTAANFFAATAKPDGLTASMLNLPAFISYSVRRKGVKYDISTIRAIAFDLVRERNGFVNGMEMSIAAAGASLTFDGGFGGEISGEFFGS